MKRYGRMPLFLILLLTCFSCGLEEENLPEKENLHLQDYVIVHSEDADEGVVKASAELHKKLKNQGITLRLQTDYLAKGETVPTDSKEILVGQTNRNAAENYRYSDYAVFKEGNKIYLDGGSDVAIRKAVEWFLANCVEGTDANIPENGFVYGAEYPLEDVTLNGVALKEYSVAKRDGTEDDRLRIWLGEKAGIRTRTDTEHRILLTGDGSLDYENVGFSTLGKDFILSYSSFLNRPEMAVNRLLEKITGRKSDEIFLSGRENVMIPDECYENLQDVREVSAKEAYFYAETDRDPLSYTVGDEIVFHIALRAEGKNVSCPKFTWLVQTDDGKSQVGECDGNLGLATVRVQATGAGFVRVKIFARDEKGQLIEKVRQSDSMNEPAIFSIGIDTASLSAGKTEPSDFDSFWASQVRTLDSVDPDVLEMTEFVPEGTVNYLGTQTAKTSDYKFYRVKIKTTSECGNVVGVLSIPKSAEKGKVSLHVNFNGYGVGDMSPYVCAGQAVLNVCAHSIELGREESYYSGLSAKGGALYNYGFEGNTSKENCYFRTMVLRDLQAVRFMKCYFGTVGVKVNGVKQALGLWNGELKLYGGSQGAFQGIAVAALDSDVTAGEWRIPWLCDVGGTIAGKMGSVFRPSYTDALRYYDTTFFAKRIRSNVQVTLCVGLGDYVCPPSGTAVLYNVMGGQVLCTFCQGMTHGYIPQQYSSVTRKK